MPLQVTEFDVTEQVRLNRQLGFIAHSVTVDNLSASWLRVQGCGRFVPPFTYGFAGSLIGGTQQANVTWETPIGILPPTAGAGQAQIIYTAGDLAPSNGQPVVTPTQQVICTVDPASVVTGFIGATASLSANKVTFDANGNSPGGQIVSFDVTVPAGANSLILDGVLLYVTLGTPAGAQVQVTGKTTGTLYLNTAAPSVSPSLGQQPQLPAFCVVSPAADSKVTVIVSANILGGSGADVSGSIEVIASFGVTSVAVEGGGTPVTVATAVGNPTFVIPGIQPPSGSSALNLVAGSAGIAAAGTATIVAGVGGQKIYLYSYSVTWAPSGFPTAANLNSACFLQYGGVSVDGTNFLTQTATGITPPAHMGNPACYGLALGSAGGALTLTAPGTGIVAGFTIVYAQY